MSHAKSLLRATTALAGTAAVFVTGVTGVTGFSIAAQAQGQPIASEEEAIEEVVITGTYIRRASQANTASPISVIGNEEFTDIGATTIADLVQTLTTNTGAQNNPDAFTQNATTGTSNVNLRGLGVASTLVLLNGKRQVGTAVTTNDGVSFVDLSSLVPTIAIERTEVLEDGAAALYGTDAVAGVVNFITRDDFEGLEIEAEYQTVTDEDQDDVRLAVIGGVQGDDWSAVASVEYLDRTALTTAEKRLSRPQDDTSALGNPGAFFTVAPIAAIDPTTGMPIVGPDGNFVVGVPAQTPFIDPTGCAEFGGFPLQASPTAPPPETGIGFCGFDFGDFFNLVPEETRLLGHAQIRYDITDWFEFGTEFSFARNRSTRNNSPTFPSLTFPLVTPDNPGFAFFDQLPFIVTDPGTGDQSISVGEQPVAFFGRAIGNGGEPSPNGFDSDTWRVAVSGTVELPNGFFIDTHFVRAFNDFTVTTRDVIEREFQNALIGLGGTACGEAVEGFSPGEGPCSFFNPFATSFGPVPNDPDVIEGFLGTQVIDAENDLTVVEAVLSGEVLDLPAGQLGVALGFQYRDQQLDQDFDAISNNFGFAFLRGGRDFSTSRDVYALFGEVRIPLLSWAELQGAVRFEDYGEGVGDTVDPKVALLAQPLDWISLRASWGTSFRAPSLFQQAGESVVLEQVNDPITGGTFFAGVRTGGFSNIQPEESEAFNVGVTVEPLPGLTADVDYWRFDFTDVIIRENAQAIVNQFPNDPSRVVRAGGPTSPIVEVFAFFRNASEVETDGIDFNVRYELATDDYGIFAPSFTATWINSYDLIDPQAGAIDAVGSRNFENFGSPTPEWRFNAALNWAFESHELNIFGRFIDSFADDQNPGVTVDSHFTVDLQYSFRLGDIWQPLEDTMLTAGSINVFNEDPPQVFTNGGFESRVHDPRGRLAYVRLRTKF